MWRVTVWVLRAKHSRARMASAEMDAAKHLRLVLQGFMSYDYKGEQRLHADDFPKALQSLGLKFGDPVVDTVMPLCQIDADSGFVRSRTPDTALPLRRCRRAHCWQAPAPAGVPLHGGWGAAPALQRRCAPRPPLAPLAPVADADPSAMRLRGSRSTG